MAPWLLRYPMCSKSALQFSLFSLIKLHLASLPLASSYRRVAVSSVFWAQNIFFSAQTRGALLRIKINTIKGLFSHSNFRPLRRSSINDQVSRDVPLISKELKYLCNF